MTKRCVGEDTERGNGDRTHDRRGPSDGWTLVNTQRNRSRTGVPFFTVLQPSDSFAAVAPFQPHHEVDNGTAFAQSKVVPEIPHVVHFEAWRALFPQRRKIHAVAVAFVFGLNAPTGEKITDGNPVAVWYGSHFSVSLLRKRCKIQ